MALPANYRIVVVNETGIAIDSGLIEADLLPFSGDGSGGVSHGTEQTGSTSSSLSAGSSATLVSVSSSTAIGLNGNVNGNLSSNGTSGPSGDLEFYIERSTDGGTSYERDPSPVAVLNYSSLADKSTTIAA
jgi:hypothetical protein